VQQFDFLIKAAVLVLLPMVPAIAIFKLFPATEAIGEGPLAGIQWKLGGAFAAYVLVAIFLLLAMKVNTNSPEYEVWTVRGRVNAGEQLISQNLLTIRTQPQDIFFAPDGSFEVKLVGQRKGSSLKFPQVVFDMSIMCFAARTISIDGRPETFDLKRLSPALKMRRDIETQIIEIETPIELLRIDSTSGGSCSS
jgi:hypothetical protein